MNKKFFVTGEAKITSLLRDYITKKMSADFCCVDSLPLKDDQKEFLVSANCIIFLHSIGKCTVEEATKGQLLTEAVIESLPKFGINATIASFIPRRCRAEEEVRGIKLQGERLVQEYTNRSGTKAVLYRMPEVFGTLFNNDILDRLISEHRTATPDNSYEFIHIDDLFYELYRMANGAPAYMGHDMFAYPQGSFFSTEANLVKVFCGFASLAPWEIPDFPSSFERQLYDYFLCNTEQKDTCQMQEGVVLSSYRLGQVVVKRLNPCERYNVDLSGASGARLLLLYGCIKTEKGTSYHADDGIVKLNLTANTMVENIGDSVAVIEMWSHSVS